MIVVVRDTGTPSPLKNNPKGLDTNPAYAPALCRL